MRGRTFPTTLLTEALTDLTAILPRLWLIVPRVSLLPRKKETRAFVPAVCTFLYGVPRTLLNSYMCLTTTDDKGTSF